INLDLIEEKIEQAAIQEAKSVQALGQAQALGQVKWSTIETMQVTPWTEENLDQNGKDHTKSWSHW
ncbi:hypothetical protein Tco_0358315, partial [Tanacetum coccineum]